MAMMHIREEGQHQHSRRAGEYGREVPSSKGLKILIYYLRKLRFFALSHLVLPALATFLKSL
jgi:hypothetical protein